MRALVLLPLLALSPHNTATEYNLAPEEGVVKVDCATQAGTAFRVGPTEYLSAAHVTSAKGCVIEGKPFKVTYQHNDFVALKVADSSDAWLKIDCGGFVRGRKYIALGYARALDSETSVDLTGTGTFDEGEAVLVGVFEVQPGQSGGPVVDAGSGEVVGIVNAADWEQGVSFSTSLRSTKLCPRS